MYYALWTPLHNYSTPINEKTTLTVHNPLLNSSMAEWVKGTYLMRAVSSLCLLYCHITMNHSPLCQINLGQQYQRERATGKYKPCCMQAKAPDKIFNSWISYIHCIQIYIIFHLLMKVVQTVWYNSDELIFAHFMDVPKHQN